MVKRVMILHGGKARDGRSAYSAPSIARKTPPLHNKTGLRMAMDRPLKILVPPGVGDIHWVMLKLRGVLKASGNDNHKPIIYVCSGDKGYDRSSDFVKMVDFVEFGGYFDITPSKLRSFTNGSFFHGHIYTNMPGFDLFLAVNKHVEQGMSIDSILPEAGPADWDYPLTVAEEKTSVDVSKHFVLATFYKASFYEDWWKQVHPGPLLREIGNQMDHLGMPHAIYLVGAAWDKPVLKELESSHRRVASLVGTTTFQQLMWLKNRAAGFLGHPSGSGMLASHLRCPTVLLWGEWRQFTKGMWTNWCRPDMLESRRYRAMPIAEDHATVAANLLEILR